MKQIIESLKLALQLVEKLCATIQINEIENMSDEDFKRLESLDTFMGNTNYQMNELLNRIKKYEVESK